MDHNWRKYWNNENNTTNVTDAKEMIKFMLANINIKPNDKVLDIGCGDGSILSLVKAKEKVGVDYSKAMIKKAKEFDIKLHNKNCWSIPYEDKYFDVSLCTSVFHYLDEEEALATLTELDRVTKRIIFIGDIEPRENFKYYLLYPFKFIYKLLTPNKTHISYYTDEYFKYKGYRIVNQPFKAEGLRFPRFSAISELWED